jgi:UDP-3-O-[3-hydroxymyristoyl] N-acetylglucosamine deacetylase
MTPVSERRLEGRGLRSGKPCRVTLYARPGPFAFRVDGAEVPLAGVTVIDSQRATTVSVLGRSIATVEHLLAACAGLGLHDSVAIEVLGDELPLLDGAAQSFASALSDLGVAPTRAGLFVARDATIASGTSHYTFSRGDTERSRLSVELSFDDPRVHPHAAWDGSRLDFARISSARTFAFGHEVLGLMEAGLASHVDPRSVVVLMTDTVLSQGTPFAADEPARHKLLDLMGDLFLYGGPPRGEVHAFRPGHAVTHDIVRIALDTGVLAPEPRR